MDAAQLQRPAGAVESGTSDTGPKHAVATSKRKKKSPSKAKRDRERWETHQAKRTSSSQGVMDERLEESFFSCKDAADQDESCSVTGQVAGNATLGRVTHDNIIPQERDRQKAMMSDDTNSEVGPSTVNVISSNLNINATEFEPRNMDNVRSSKVDLSDISTKSGRSVSTSTDTVSNCDVAIATDTVNIATSASQCELSDINLKPMHSVSISTDTVAYCDVAIATVAVDTTTSSSQCESSDISLKSVHTVSTSTDSVGYNEVALATNIITTSENASHSEYVDYLSNFAHSDIVKTLFTEVERLTSNNTQLTTMNGIWLDRLDEKQDKIEELESKSMKEMNEIKEQLRLKHIELETLRKQQQHRGPNQQLPLGQGPHQGRHQWQNQPSQGHYHANGSYNPGYSGNRY